MFFFKKKSIINLVSIVIIACSIFRGFIVLSLNNPNYTNIVYGICTILIILLSLYSFFQSFNSLDIEKRYLKILFYNLILYSIYFLIEIIFKHNIDLSIFNFTFIPYLVFIFIKIEEKYFTYILIFTSIFFSFFTFYDFYISNLLGNNDLAIYYQNLLRPTTNEAFSRTGEFIRPGGILGSAHDTGNIFGILTIFFLCKFILLKKYSFFYILLFFISFFSLLLTQSASNIIACFFVLIFVSGYFLRKYPFKLFNALLLGIFIISIIFIFINQYIPFDVLSEILTIWTNRTSSEGDWEGMVNGYQFLNINDFFHFFFGHASITKSNLVNSEVSFIKILFDIGIFGFVYLFSIITFPLKFSKQNYNPEKIYPSYFSIIFCIISLIHYGSIFRMPNILLLIILNTLIFQQKMKVNNIKYE